MADFAKEVVTVDIEQELKQSYLDYAMSVIVGRALPDVRDGLKPVHRRVLFSMYQLGNEWNKPHKKSARIVGDVIGKYHPHGDMPVYDTIVRMAQPFSLRYPLVDGQGNFGSVDGDAPAAMRYTEIRMAKITQLLLADLEKETVDFVPNYDETEQMPVVLPARIPNLLVNGSSGIAVGMATNIPPHNLKEVINACLVLLENPEASLENLLAHIQGPDFPTAGIIYGKAGIIEAYRTGRGRIFVRARTRIETDEDSGKQTIIVTELPYQVNKAKLVEKIAELVKEKQIEGITLLRDESDKDGLRIIMELRRGEIAEVVLNNLFAQTQLQVVFGINMVALSDDRPQLLSLHSMLEAFLRHRREIVTRRTLFELKASRARAHILEGLGIALSNIDEMIAMIKASKNPPAAKEALLGQRWRAGIVAEMLSRAGSELSRPEGLNIFYGLQEGHQYQLSPEQAQAILDLRLHRLTGLEQDKIYAEYQEILTEIQNLMEILQNPHRLLEVIREELIAVREEYSDKRLTEIQEVEADLTIEDLITDQPMVVTLSQDGYAKIQPLDQYQAQRRGGKGKTAAQVKEEDFIEHLLIANSLDTLLCFSNLGKVYWLKVYKLPEASRQSKGRPLVNLLPLAENEKISAIVPVREYQQDHYIFMATSQGTIKKVSLLDFSRPRTSGIIALDLAENDRLIGAQITDGKQDVMLFSDAGKVIRFSESIVRGMGRNARGVRGMRLLSGQKVVSLLVAKPEGAILTVTENGYGKRTSLEEYSCKLTRGGQGIVSILTSERNGKVIGAIQVFLGDEVMLISDKGMLVRIRADEVSLVGRNTQGVRLITLGEGEKLVGVERVETAAQVENNESV